LATVLEIEPTEVQTYYTLTCLTAPLFGIIIGGCAFGCLGGYDTRGSFLLVVIMAFFACISAMPVPFLYSKLGVYICLWLVLFCGAFVLPTITGIMLNSVAESMRAQANSLAVLAYNLLGYLPAPFLYGFVSTIQVDLEEEDPEIKSY
jgi:predicted metal-binding membrane protein